MILYGPGLTPDGLDELYQRKLILSGPLFGPHKMFACTTHVLLIDMLCFFSFCFTGLLKIWNANVIVEATHPCLGNYKYIVLPI